MYKVFEVMNYNHLKQILKLSQNAEENELVFTAPPFKNLALQGGGVRGVAEVGAYKALREFKYENISDETAIDHICNIAGTSCGAINGLLITLGYTPEELTELAGKELFSKLNDHNNKFTIFRSLLEFNLPSVMKGEQLTNFLKQLIFIKTGNENITFKQLFELCQLRGRPIHLIMTGTNLTRSTLDYFSAITTPDMPVALATRISASIPGYFSSINYNDEWIVDGGVMSNLPIEVFDNMAFKALDTTDQCVSKSSTNQQTIGISLKLEEITPDHHQPSFGDVKRALFDTTATVLANPTYKANTVRIDHHDQFGKVIKPTDMSISKSQVEHLRTQGYKSTLAHLENKFKAQTLTFESPEKKYEFLLSSLISKTATDAPSITLNDLQLIYDFAHQKGETEKLKAVLPKEIAIAALEQKVTDHTETNHQPQKSRDFFSAKIQLLKNSQHTKNITKAYVNFLNKAQEHTQSLHQWLLVSINCKQKLQQLSNIYLQFNLPKWLNTLHHLNPIYIMSKRPKLWGMTLSIFALPFYAIFLALKLAMYLLQLVVNSFIYLVFTFTKLVNKSGITIFPRAKKIVGANTLIKKIKTSFKKMKSRFSLTENQQNAELSVLQVAQDGLVKLNSDEVAAKCKLLPTINEKHYENDFNLLQNHITQLSSLFI